MSVGLIGTGVAFMAVFALNFFGVTPNSTAANSSGPKSLTDYRHGLPERRQPAIVALTLH